MKRIARALAAAAACVFAQQATAADFPAAVPLLRAPSAIIAANWGGVYIGGHAGYAALDGSYIVNDGFIERYTLDTDGFLGGGQIGVQAQWGHWVVGIEGSYSWADLTQTHNSALDPARSTSVDLRHIGTLAGRLGWAADRWLIYGKGGLAWGRVHTFNRATAGLVAFDDTVWEPGYTLGLGLDYMWLPNWVLGLEFDYYAFTFNRALASGGVNAAITDSNADVYAVMVRMSYLFNTRW